MTISEGDLSFHFGEECSAVKFDDDEFYRKTFSALPHSKGVDIVAMCVDSVSLIEVKDFRGHEAENRRRILPNSKNSDTLDAEVSLKVAMTIACLYGAFSKGMSSSAANALAAYYSAFSTEKIPKGKKRINVLLFMEGSFEFHSRSKKTLMNELRKYIAVRLRWLNCTVRVVDSQTYPSELFEVQRAVD